MRITGLSASQFAFCVQAVSAANYGGNVVVHWNWHDRTTNKDGTLQCTARLAVTDSHGQGSRTSWNGRHGPYACWHAYRDVLAAVFFRYPRAVIVTQFTTYRGMEGFLAAYPETAHQVVGSVMNPVTMPELCECSRRPEYSEAEFGVPRVQRRAYETDQRSVIANASRQYARSAELLGEDHIDEYVFGPYNGNKETDLRRARDLLDREYLY